MKIMKTRQKDYILMGIFYLILGIGIFSLPAKADESTSVSYHTVSIENVDIFYREAGNPERPTLLLLHGFPTSSHMFRELIPALADDYHLIDTGHFALESHGPEIAGLIRSFLKRKIDSPSVAAR
jgi:hypothetical protein